MEEGRLHSIETFGAVDGPGIRTVFFLQGCPARCLYCHNPDTWKRAGGDQVQISALVDRAKRGSAYYGKDGGVTFSGGEPLMQGLFLTQAIQALKKAGISSIIDTSGTYSDEYTSGAIEACQMLLLDVKHSNPAKFKEIAGVDQGELLKVIDIINSFEKHVWVRQVIIPGINDDYENMDNLADFVKKIRHIDKIELLPYHTMAVNKYKKLGMKYRLDGVPAMDAEKTRELEEYIREKTGIR